MEENILNIVSKLKEKTSKKSIAWEKTSGQDEYKLQFKKGTLTISYFEDIDGDNITLIIYNENGDIITNLLFIKRDEPNEYKTLKELHDIINKNHYKVDETLNDMLNELDDDDL